MDGTDHNLILFVADETAVVSVVVASVCDVDDDGWQMPSRVLFRRR
jgi:hypothetical protein